MTTTTLLDDLLARLDLVVFERLPEGVFLHIGRAQPPGWFSRLFQAAAEAEPITIGQAFPFLEHFLAEAEEFWRGPGESRLRSGPFIMTDPGRGEVALVASAVTVAHRRFLVLELPYDLEEHRRALQSAREHGLAHEEHVRRTGALLAPLEEAQQLLRQLSTTTLSSEQQRLAEAVREHLAGVTASVDALAPRARHLSRTRN